MVIFLFILNILVLASEEITLQPDLTKITFSGVEGGKFITLDLNDIYRHLKQQTKFLVLTSNSTTFTENLLKLFEEIFALKFPGDILHIQSDTDGRIMSDFLQLGLSTGFPSTDNVDIYYIFDLIQYYDFTGGLFVFHEASPDSKIIYTMSQYVAMRKDVKYLVGSDTSEWDPSYFRVLWIDKWKFKDDTQIAAKITINESRLTDAEYYNKLWSDRRVVGNPSIEEYLTNFLPGFKKRTIRRKGNVRYNVILP